MDGRTDGRTHQPTKLHYKDKVHPGGRLFVWARSSDPNLTASTFLIEEVNATLHTHTQRSHVNVANERCAFTFNAVHAQRSLSVLIDAV